MMPTQPINDFAQLKKEWTGLFKETGVSDKAARQARFRSLQERCVRTLQAHIQELDQFYHSQFQKSLYDVVFEEDYFSMHPSDRPNEDEYVPYQMGKFHQVINNSLYTLEAYSQGFIGCLIGSLFIGAGTFVGAALRDLLALQKLYNTQNLSEEDLAMMRSYMYYKIRHTLNTKHRTEAKDCKYQNRIALMLGLIDRRSRAAIEPRVQDIFQEYARQNHLDWDADKLKESELSIIADYEQTYPWTKDFIKTLENYCTEHPQLETDNHKWRFILTLAFPMRLLASRSTYLPDEKEVDDEDISALKKDVIALIRCTPTDCQAALRQQFHIDEATWKAHPVHTKNNFEVIATGLIPEAEFKAPNPVLFSLFGKLQDNYAHIKEIQEARRNRPYQLGMILANAAKEAAWKTASVNYEYLMGSTEAASHRSERHHLLTQRPGRR